MVHTMNDVAEPAEESPSTVSRVLSKSPFISEETLNRVMAAVQSLNYHRTFTPGRWRSARAICSDWLFLKLLFHFSRSHSRISISGLGPRL
jgi:hypothetical protein